MLVEELKKKISETEFAHCTDAILSLVLDKPRSQINNNDIISDEDVKLCEELAIDFKKSYPLIYQRGKMYFMDLPLIITKDVFSPVFATEPFVNKIINDFKDKKNMLEIGTGSGAMSIVIAKRAGAKIVATDICPKALEIARKNAEQNKVNIEFRESDLFNNITEKFDLIFSNPPQSKTETVDKSEREGKLVIPRLACDGGNDGFYLYNKIKSEAKKFLNKDGVLVLQYDGYINIYNYNEL